MSKQTGNFLTLTESVSKFSADGELALLIYACFYVFQMSKSTGNFLTLAEATEKFSADGLCVFYLFIYHFLPLVTRKRNLVICWQFTMHVTEFLDLYHVWFL